MKRLDVGSGTMLHGHGRPLGLLCALFFLGGLFGCFFVSVLDMSETQALFQYLSDYLSLVCDEISPRAFWPTVRNRLWEFFVLVVVGMTWLGLFVIPLLLWLRGFLFAFSVGCFCRVYGIAGLLPGAFLFVLPALFWGPAVFWIGSRGVERSLAQLRKEAWEEDAAWWIGLALCCGLFVLCVVVEWFAVPVLLRAAARVVL